MALYRGDDRNNDLVGTGADDAFRPGLGVDTVNGGGGYDRLIVDYSATSPSAMAVPSLVAAGSSTTASFQRGGDGYDGRIVKGANSVTFGNIDFISFKDDGQAGTLAVDASLLLDGAGRRILYDAGASSASKVLTLNFSDVYGGAVRSGANNAVVVNDSLFQNFNEVHIDGVSFAQVKLGATTDFVTTGFNNGGNNIQTGGGNDTITSIASYGDVIDGGDGTDSWIGRYNGFGGLDLDDRTGIRNLATLKNIERIDLTVDGPQSTFNIYKDTTTIHNGSANGATANINFDAETTGGSGFILRDQDGLVVQAARQTGGTCPRSITSAP